MAPGMNALELVHKVATLTSRVRNARAGGADLARAATVRLIRVSTVVARQMQKMPMPRPRPIEHIALASAATHLRAVAEAAGALDAHDPDTPEGALSELIEETLALVHKMLAGTPEMAHPNAARELPAAPEPDDEAPKKVSF